MTAAMGFSVLAADPVPATTTASAPAVVTVNGKTLSTGDLQKESQALMAQVARQARPEQGMPSEAQIRQQALVNMVNKQLLLQAVAERKIKVGDDEIKKTIDDVMKNVPPGQTLEDVLKHAGLDQKEFTQQITDSLSIQKLIAEETKVIVVTDEDAGKYYTDHPEIFKRGETVSARHILIMFAPGDDDAKKAEKKKKLSDIRDRIVKGEDFAKVCAETSEDPGSKNNGGLYENFPRGQMVPPFDNAAFTQKIGEIGPVIETSFGYHIIKVEKHSDGSAAPLAEVKDRLKTFLDGQKKQEFVTKYIKGLHDSAKITYADGYAPAPEVAAPATPKN
jgi:parvulin-like peptidyl-prolyl isomerase